MTPDEQQNELATAYYNRGNIHFQNGDYDKAIADYDQVILLKPNNANAYYNRSRAYDDKGEYEKVQEKI